MEYPSVYVPWLCITLISLYCATLGVYRNGTSVYICECRVEEYRATYDVTPRLINLLGAVRQLSPGVFSRSSVLLIGLNFRNGHSEAKPTFLNLNQTISSISKEIKEYLPKVEISAF